MKKIEELGISPTPWKFTDNLIGTKKHFNRGDGLMFAWLDSLHLEADARLIAAAPELYDAAERYVRFLDESCINGNRSSREILSDLANAFKDLKAALAKAAGESEVKK